MPEGFLSDHLVSGLEPGTIVRLAAPEGDFALPDPPPAKSLFLVGGSGITPVMSMLRTLDRRGTMPRRVLLYSSPTEDRMIFRDELRRARTRSTRRCTVFERFTDGEGMFELDRARDGLPRLARARDLGLRPGADARRGRGVLGARPASRTSCTSSASRSTSAAATPRAAPITFANSGKTVEVDGATTLLEAGEQAGVGMPYGCRIGICHTCTLPMASGRIKDLRNGEEHADPNEAIQTCVTAACGD